ncbi:hypothetical protein D1007_46529 [Hordeum vulgare]|nr:hypothetical protein D1007_46529 [Hordeum vulgare]
MDVSSCVPPSLPESAAAAAAAAAASSALVLLDRWSYIGDLPNNTTAESTMSSGLPIKVTFHAARPPHLSHFFVHCPGLDLSRIGAKIVATDAHLVLLRVPIDPDRTTGALDWDYFLYSPRAQRLDLLPNPDPIRCLNDDATALISRKDGAGYAVAALGDCKPIYDGDEHLIRCEFNLHLYRPSSKSKAWISKRLSVNGLERDKLIPLPGAVDRLYHETGKTITIGGEHGTVAWVDLWRGIFFCDVLKKRPLLQDIPLPVPARSSWDRLLRNGNPSYLRDVTISQNKDSIKYVELEFRSRQVLNAAATTPVSYTDWVRNNTTRKSQSQVIRDGWKSTTWNVAIPVGGLYEGWHPDCVFDVKDVSLEPCLSDWMTMLSSKTMQELKWRTPS